ncbi:hypothetical protein [Nonomuraea rubra]
MDMQELIERAASLGIDLEPYELEDSGDGVTIDGMDAEEWLAAMASE